MTYVVVFVVIMLAAIAFSFCGVALGRWWIRPYVAEGHNDVLVPIFLTAGVIYAVLLGFMVVAQLDTYEAAHANVAEEASLLVPMYRQSEVMAADKGAEMRALIRDYAKLVAEDWTEFAETSYGSPKARLTVDRIVSVFSSLRPATKAREIISQQFLTTFSQLILDRNKRILAASESLSWIVWVAAIGVGTVVIAMTFILYADRYGPHAIMSSILAALIGLLLFLMLVLDHPFRGPLAITPEPFETDSALFDQIDQDFAKGSSK